MERICAAGVDFSSPDRFKAYNERITAALTELYYMPIDYIPRVRRLFCELLNYLPAAFQQNNTEPWMARRERADSPVSDDSTMGDDTAMDIDLEVTPAAPSQVSSQVSWQPDPVSAPMDIDMEATPAAPSHLSWRPDPVAAPMDVEM